MTDRDTTRGASEDEIVIVEIAGRWATLSNGDRVTAVPPFFEFNYDEAKFYRAIARFHADPVGVLNEGIVERWPDWKPKS